MRAPKLPQPRVLIRSTYDPSSSAIPVPAPFGRSMYDVISHTHANDNDKRQQSLSQKLRHFDRMLVTLEECFDETSKETSVIIGPHHRDHLNDNNRTKSKGKSWSVPFARAITEPSLNSDACPTVSLSEMNWYTNPDNKPKREHVRIGVVAAVRDTSSSSGKVLLTRRAPHMRSFPHAWVMPGGGLDIGETLAECCAREVREETGVEVDLSSVEPRALWESCYPTSGQACVAAGTGITAHYLVVFCTAEALEKDAKKLRECIDLDAEETDLATWLSLEDFRKTLDHPMGGIEMKSIPSISAPSSSSELALEELCGIYPRGEAMKGIAQGNMFLVEELL